MPNKTFSYTCYANLHDIDAAGVMFFTRYFQHAHDAYERFMAEIGFSLTELIHQHSMLPLVHSEADFHQAVRHGERLDIELRIARIGNSSFTVNYLFRNSQAATVAHLQTRHVMLSPENQRPRVLPQPLQEALNAYRV